MPWKNQEDFKKSETFNRLVAHYRKKGKSIPSGVSRQFMSVVNSASKKGLPEDRAIASAWAAIKHHKR